MEGGRDRSGGGRAGGAGESGGGGGGGGEWVGGPAPVLVPASLPGEPMNMLEKG